MATRARARELFDRSRVALGRSAVAAAHLLDPDRHPPLRSAEAARARAIAPAPVTVTSTVHSAPAAAPLSAVPTASTAASTASTAGSAASTAPSTATVVAEPGDAAEETGLVDVCASIALRDLNLIDTLLSDLELMERHEDDSHRLDQLYRLDHLAARLRRNAENLRVLADHDVDSDAGETISVLDTVRAAMSSIDQYAKVGIGRMAPLGIVGFAANDLSRVLTELLDNAANHSPPRAEVRVSSHLTEQGSVLIRIEDDGIGLPAARLAELNGRLTQTSRLDDAAVRHMGLAVVRRLAERHGLRVSLDHRLPNGTTATVLVPSALVTDVPSTTWTGTQTVPVRAGRHRDRQAETNGVVPESLGAETGGVDTLSLPEPDAGLPRRSLAPRQRAAAESEPHAAFPTASAAPSAPAEPSVPRLSPLPTRPPSPAVDGTTESGLPRRVSRSIKPGAAVSAPTDFTSDSDGQDAFLSDLDSFTDGEKAANAEGSGTSPDPSAEPSPASSTDLGAESSPASSTESSTASSAEPDTGSSSTSSTTSSTVSSSGSDVASSGGSDAESSSGGSAADADGERGAESEHGSHEHGDRDGDAR